MLRDKIRLIAESAGAEAVAVAVYDFEHDIAWTMHGERWFHAASTIKVPVLLGVYDAIEHGRLQPYSRVHVRNRFLSVVDGRPFAVSPGRDANTEVHTAIGKMLTVHELAEHMIVTSSNLATNLLIDLIGIDNIHATLHSLSLTGIDLQRCIEDEAGWRANINNRITAEGYGQALRLIAERKAISEVASDAMLEILHDQRFRGGIPAGVPDAARVANKTGEMSTVAHDGGIVYLDGREPYVVVILTQWRPEAENRRHMIASISRAVYEHIKTTRDDD
jgi:beta-lactamase class A